MISSLRVLKTYTPTPEDQQRVSAMARSACPRRYCWWWRSLAFHWELSPTEGCTFLRSKKPNGWKHIDTPCTRADTQSPIDHYEPREPNLMEDGLPIGHFMPNKIPPLPRT